MKFKTFELENGLKVVVHEDKSTKIAVLNVLYDVGSRDEDPEKTGFAHLFEHLMFGGSKNIPLYDEPLQKVGGENNAFTSPDLTNYYISIPSNNLETAFWLESDRMLSLSFDPKVLEVQRKVVIEEFKQRYLNQPYGDAWLKLRPLAYEKHPYRWATIGKEIAHIENATMEDVKAFFYKFYVPNNAVLVVAGDVDFDEVKKLTEKWFGPIPKGAVLNRNLPVEPKQEVKRTETIEANVPVNSIYKVYHTPERLSPDYYSTDLLSDILGGGRSSKLHETLVKEKRYMSSANAYITGSIDSGLLVINGKPNKDISYEQVENEIDNIVTQLQTELISDFQLEKIKNLAESSHIFGEMELLNKAYSLAYFTLLGDTNLINKEVDKIRAVTSKQIMESAQYVLRPENSSTLYYNAKPE
ncbi:pitrilysin family protein [Reichenbachiella sp. MALMAid0571]|uniref:M16 family metallopeptidase n=1 Tax=Reichenbachiella sp. MALMAid0571 TaxID=3143939 RepID=UPI0032DF496D